MPSRFEFLDNEEQKLGCVSSSEWQSYTWKNELVVQKERIGQHLDEVFKDIETEHSPLHMIERAVGLAAVCMRRLIECRLVTDQFKDGQLEVHYISRKKNSEWREPFLRNTAREIFINYDLTSRVKGSMQPKKITDRLLHARVIGILSGNEYIPDGILIASDKQHRDNVFHFTPDEFDDFINSFLDDRINSMADGFIRDENGEIQTDKVFATRD